MGEHCGTYPVKLYELDFKGNIKFLTLFNYMQEVAGEHADLLGVGFDSLKEKGIFWVLSKITLKLDKVPAGDKNIKVSTWPKALGKLYASRDFIIEGDVSGVFAYATSLWLVVDIETRRPVRIEKIFNDRFSYEKSIVDRHAITGEPPKIDIKDGLHLSGETLKTASYSDSDPNGHINNAKIVSWINDCFDADFYLNNTISEINVNFISEIKMGDKIKLCLYDSEKDKEFLIKAEDDISGKLLFTGSVRIG